MSLEEAIKERELSACNVLIATILAEFWNYGFINQGTINLITRKIADSLVAFYKTQEEDKSFRELSFSKELIELMIKKFVESLNPFPMPEIIELEEDKEFEFKIRSDKCKFCPKGVGQAEIPGTLCMFPSLIKWILEDYTGEHISATNISKEEGKCVFFLSKEIN